MPATRPEVEDRRYALPAWLGSVLAHGLLIVLLASVLRYAPQGAAEEAVRTVGLVLKTTADEREYFTEEEDIDTRSDESNAAASRDSATAAHDDHAMGLADGPPSDPTSLLPEMSKPAAPIIGAGSPAAGGLSGATGLTGGPAPNRQVTKGRAQTGVFGVQGEGYKFVYVFDRSGSMGGSGQSSLAAAKVELLASIERLEAHHQFQIIFYNDQPAILDIVGRGRLVFGTDQNKALARKFIAGISADGSTDHEDPLLLALRLQPDVIFFLTDADEPSLSTAQLEKIRRLNGEVTSINTIEFGIGPDLRHENFLVKLARENGGQHVYVDMLNRRRAKD
ncbi:MAG: hypothetical protein AB7U73_03990 [Pirellulales bacterium]